jgi:hypothetical protein
MRKDVRVSASGIGDRRTAAAEICRGGFGERARKPSRGQLRAPEESSLHLPGIRDRIGRCERARAESRPEARPPQRAARRGERVSRGESQR